MVTSANERLATEQDGISHRVAQRDANETDDRCRPPKTDAQGLVELACECTKADCERFVKVPLDVYRRMLEADQYLLQAGHHAFAQYRTIISVGLMRIEERRLRLPRSSRRLELVLRLDSTCLPRGAFFSAAAARFFSSFRSRFSLTVAFARDLRHRLLSLRRHTPSFCR